MGYNILKVFHDLYPTVEINKFKVVDDCVLMINSKNYGNLRFTHKADKNINLLEYQE